MVRIYLDVNIVISFFHGDLNRETRMLREALRDVFAHDRGVRVYTSNHVLLCAYHVLRQQGHAPERIAESQRALVASIKGAGGQIDMVAEAATQEGRSVVRASARAHDHFEEKVVRNTRGAIVRTWVEEDIEDEAMLRAIERLEAAHCSHIALVSDDREANRQWVKRGGTAFGVAEAARRIQSHALLGA